MAIWHHMYIIYICSHEINASWIEYLWFIKITLNTAARKPEETCEDETMKK